MSIEIHAKTSTPSIDNQLHKDPATVVTEYDKEARNTSLDIVPNNKNNKANIENQSIEISRESIEEAVGKLQDYADQYKRQIRFSVDDDTGRTVVRLYDKEDNVLRQIPSEEVLSLLKSIEQNKGLLFEEHV